MRWATLSLLVLGVCAAAHLQTPLFAPRPHAASKSSKGNGDFPGFGAPSLSGGFAKLAASEIDIRAAAAFAPTVRSFDELSESAYSVLTHPAYPRHSVRVKKSKFCDGSVDAYTGYIDVEARHLFFYFFKSRGNWTEDDIIFWTNGGPGCSSAMGLFMELGPCRILDESGPSPWKYGWNEHANIFFIDQPVGVGFSYADHGEYLTTTEEAAIDAAAFSFVFFEHFSELKGNAFHMSGESYAGRYIPLFASAVYDLNPRLVKAGLDAVNLSSIMIGNGLTDSETMLPSYYDMQCASASVAPVQDISTCVRMKVAAQRCGQKFKASCTDTFDAMDCAAASAFCESELTEPYFGLGMNPYDMSKKCEGSLENAVCYPDFEYVLSYLSLPETRAALGVDDVITGDFASCSTPVNIAFLANGDELHPTGLWVAGLLERGVRVLLYVGEYDFVCNWVGNSRWIEALEWSGHAMYQLAKERVWEIDGNGAGRVRSAGPLTFATIRAAGHLVPYDKPKESLEMVRRWLKNEEF